MKSRPTILAIKNQNYIKVLKIIVDKLTFLVYTITLHYYNGKLCAQPFLPVICIISYVVQKSSIYNYFGKYYRNFA